MKSPQNGSINDSVRTTSNRVESVVGEENTSEALLEVEQLENNFQRIQDGFLEAIKNDKEKADYVQRMKVANKSSFLYWLLSLERLQYSQH